MRMRDIWIDGSSARKREWYDTSTYHPTTGAIRQNKRIDIQYIEPIEQWRAKHPTRAKLQAYWCAIIYTTKHRIKSIPTQRIAIANAGMLLATQWLNYALGFILICGGMLHKIGIPYTIA